MRYRLVLCDFDGTLADTLGRLLHAYNEVAGRRGFRPVTDPEAVRGLAPKELLRQYDVSLVQLPFLVREVLAAMKGEMANVPLFRALGALQAIRHGGCRLAVLSSNARPNILTCLRANKAEELFEVVVGYPRLFGKARGIRRLLKSLEVERRASLYVGDEIRDVEAARKAGVAIAAVTWGFNNRQVLADCQPDYLIDHPDQLLGCVAGRTARAE